MNSHSLLIGYVLWFFGFMGAHRFYYGKTKTAILYFFTFGVFGIGWFLDLFFMPSLDRQADKRFPEKFFNYNVAWLFLVFLGFFGVHRFYLRKYFSGILWLLTGGLFLVGYLYDLCTLNEQIRERDKDFTQST